MSDKIYIANNFLFFEDCAVPIDNIAFFIEEKESTRIYFKFAGGINNPLKVPVVYSELSKILAKPLENKKQK